MNLQSVLQLSRTLKEVHFKHDEVIFREGEPAKFIFLIKDGEIETTKRIFDKFSRLMVPERCGKYYRGMLIGDKEVLAGGGSRTFTAVCLTDCTVLPIAPEKYKQLYNNTGNNSHL